MTTRREGLSRRAFMEQGSRAAAGVVAGVLVPSALMGGEPGAAASKMRFGLVTYQWGRDWDLPTLIRNCQSTGALGVELRVEHAHQVTPALSSRQRAEVRLRFENSPVEVLGLGTNWAFHYADAARVQAEIEGAKADIVLGHDIGASGVKVKPNGLPAGVPVAKTVEQIGTSLNTLGRFADDFGQEVRVEVHGEKTQELPIMQQIMEVADHPRVTVCWNCNDQDLIGQGLQHNFNLVKDRLGSTVHVREFNEGSYPYPELFKLLAGVGYNGWILMEARTEPVSRIKALAEQRALFDELASKAG